MQKRTAKADRRSCEAGRLASAGIKTDRRSGNIPAKWKTQARDFRTCCVTVPEVPTANTGSANPRSPFRCQWRTSKLTVSGGRRLTAPASPTAVAVVTLLEFLPAPALMALILGVIRSAYMSRARAMELLRLHEACSTSVLLFQDWTSPLNLTLTASNAALTCR
jgi:hypothetical protein